MANACKTCNGVYLKVQSDGGSYNHACPPLSAVEYKALTPAWDGTNLPTIERTNKVDENKQPVIGVITQ